MFVCFCFSIMFHSLAFLLGMFVLAQHLPWRSYSGHSYKCHCVVAAVTVSKQTNINYVITTREAQNMTISKRFWLDVWNTKRNTHTSYSIMSVWSWRSSNCSHQECGVWTKRLWNNKKHWNEFRPSLICFQPQSLEVKAALKDKDSPRMDKLHSFQKVMCFLFATFLVHFISSLFHIILQLSLHVIAIFITTKWFHKWFYKSFKKTKAHPFWTFFNDTMLKKKKRAYELGVLMVSCNCEEFSSARSDLAKETTWQADEKPQFSLNSRYSFLLRGV